jgi:tetraacyldisaccharide 4'-kinase
MDDGFQNPSLNKHLSLVVIDGTRGVGNGAVFPAGPLRAPLSMQADRTAALIIVGDGSAAEAIARMVAGRGGLVLRARFKADDASVDALRAKPILAFAGIGDPERFFATLRASGVAVKATRSFPDHHRYSDRELAALAVEAERGGLTLVTTTKDLARLRRADGRPPTHAIAGFSVRLVVDDEAALRQRLLQAVTTARQAARAA